MENRIYKMIVDVDLHEKDKEDAYQRITDALDDLPQDLRMKSFDLNFYQEFKYDDFSYFEDDELPKLVISYKLRPIDIGLKTYYYAPRLINRDGVEWKKISHQCGGIACEQEYLIARTLPTTEIFDRLVKELREKYYEDSYCKFSGSITLDDIIEYRSILRKYGLDCNHHYKYFKEAFYPIDLNDQYSEILSGEKISLDYANSFIEDTDNIRAFLNYWRLFILDINCD